MPSASSRAKPRSIPRTAPPPRRGRTAATTPLTWRRPTEPSAASERTSPASMSTQRSPPQDGDHTGPLPVVGHRVGHLLRSAPSRGSMPPRGDPAKPRGRLRTCCAAVPDASWSSAGPVRASPPTPSGCWPASGSSTTWPAGARPGPDDPEWADRVALHRARRPASWRTVETLDLAGVLGRPGPPVLVDCLTTWLAGTMDACGVWDDEPRRRRPAGRRRRRPAGGLVGHPPPGGRGQQRGGQRDRAGHRVGTAVPRRDGRAQRPRGGRPRSGWSW